MRSTLELLKAIRRDHRRADPALQTKSAYGDKSARRAARTALLVFDSVEGVDDIGREVNGAGGDVVFEVVDAGGPGNEHGVGCPLQQPSEPDLRGGDVERVRGGLNGGFVSDGLATGVVAAEGEERYPSDSLVGAELQQILEPTVDQTVGVLDTDDAGGEGPSDAGRLDAADPDAGR